LFFKSPIECREECPSINLDVNELDISREPFSDSQARETKWGNLDLPPEFDYKPPKPP